jgi:hypothetical protein
VNYVERTPDYIASHFGVPMAKALFELEPNDLVWRGPYVSPYGVHLVQLITNERGREPELAEIEDRVREDAKRAMIKQETEAAVSEIVGTYDVQIVYEREPSPNADRAENR